MDDRSPFRRAIDDIYGCDRCNLCNFRSNICIYRGSPKARVMVVGEAPGEQEDRQGKPMVGKTGSYLVETLGKLGLPLQELFITNAVLCRPPDNAEPTKEQMDACSEWLWMMIELVNPSYILATGRIAMGRLDPGFVRRGGKITPEEGICSTPPGLKGAVLIPLRHPSAILRSESRSGILGDPQIREGYERRLEAIVSMIKEGRAF